MMEFTFEQSPWEAELQQLGQGDSLSAVRFLTLLEDAADDELENAFSELEERRITLDISSLPMFSVVGAGGLRLRQEQELVEKGRLLEGLEEQDPLRLYLEELARTPAAGDVTLLARDCAMGDRSAAERLATLQLSRTVELAMEYTGKGVLLLDLMQEASLGLWRSILCYTGGDFEAHSDWWIRQYLARAVVIQARAGGLGQKLRQGLEDYRDVEMRLSGELGRGATVEEIAEAMHVTGDYASVLEGMLSLAKGKQLMAEPEESGKELEDEDQSVENTAYFQSRQRVLELLSTISETEANVLTLRFGLEGGLPLNPEQTGKKLGLTPEEVARIEMQALAKLRQESD